MTFKSHSRRKHRSDLTVGLSHSLNFQSKRNVQQSSAQFDVFSYLPAFIPVIIAVSLSSLWSQLSNIQSMYALQGVLICFVLTALWYGIDHLYSQFLSVGTYITWGYICLLLSDTYVPDSSMLTAYTWWFSGVTAWIIMVRNRWQVFVWLVSALGLFALYTIIGNYQLFSPEVAEPLSYMAMLTIFALFSFEYLSKDIAPWLMSKTFRATMLILISAQILSVLGLSFRFSELSYLMNYNAILLLAVGVMYMFYKVRVKDAVAKFINQLVLMLFWMVMIARGIFQGEINKGQIVFFTVCVLFFVYVTLNEMYRLKRELGE